MGQELKSRGTIGHRSCVDTPCPLVSMSIVKAGQRRIEVEGGPPIAGQGGAPESGHDRKVEDTLKDSDQDLLG
jgi:hypothetical protein